MKLAVPEKILVTEQQRTEAGEILARLRQSHEGWYTHYLNAQIQMYNPYWVAVLILGAERANDSKQFLSTFRIQQINEKARELRWPGHVAEAILEA
ncbi:MAG: hypothetical protein WDZ93_01315, partial [Candidatus Paceibacterota bacterium]